MAKYRSGRINEEVKRELAAILREVKDPRIPELVSIVGVEVTPDLKYAKIHVSFLGGAEQAAEGLAGIRAASGYIRRELAHRIRLRQTPELTFVADDSIAYGAHITKILKDIAAASPEEEKDEPAEE